MSAPLRRAAFGPYGRALAVAAAGVALAWALGLPVPFLLGPLFAGLAAALAGVRMAAWRPAMDLSRIVLGLAVGASVTPELVGRAGEMAGTVALTPVFAVVCLAVGYPYFRRVAGFDRTTAYFSSAPGGLADMVVFAEEAGANVRAVSLVHATRVLVIVAVVPAILAWVYGLTLDAAPGAPASALSARTYAVMIVCGLGGAWAARRAGLFGATILGPLAAAAVASLTGLLDSRPPAEAILAAQFFVGLAVAVKYVGVTVAELRRVVLAGLGQVAILALLTLAFAEAAFLVGGAPQVEILLAFAPGGQAEMAVLAIVAGADVAFVVTHHLVRIVTVILGAPLLFRRDP